MGLLNPNWNNWQAAPPGLKGLLARQFDPKELRYQAGSQALINAGLSLMNPDPQAPPSMLGSIGRAISGAAQGAQEGRDRFYEDGFRNIQLNELQREQDSRDAQQAAMDKLIPTLPPEIQDFARAYPQQFGEAYMKAQMPGEGYTLSPGQNRYDASGKLIVQGPPPDAGNKPAAIQEYEYAKAQGFPGSFQDWEASKKGGMSLQVDPATGAITFQQGSNIKPMTEAQSKDTVFATRAEGASRVLEPIADELTSLGGNLAGSVPLIGNALKPEKFQQAEQAGKEFLQAILRKDTGAAITPAETAEYGSVYLPRYGDGEEVKKQKSASRARAIAALKAGMTPQAILAQEKALQAGVSVGTGAQQQGNPPPGIDPEIWQHMTPEERALWN